MHLLIGSCQHTNYELCPDCYLSKTCWLRIRGSTFVLSYNISLLPFGFSLFSVQFLGEKKKKKKTKLTATGMIVGEEEREEDDDDDDDRFDFSLQLLPQARAKHFYIISYI